MNDEPSYQFIDTNILVYAHDISAGAKHERAKRLMRHLWGTQTGCVSIQVLQELYVTLTHKVAMPLGEEAVQQIITDLSFWRVHTPNAQDVLGAISLRRRYGISFWDAMILWSAAQLGCHMLWSEDLNRGQMYAGVQVVNPFEADFVLTSPHV
jgi:predicted nucleic acid-binding protein